MKATWTIVRRPQIRAYGALTAALIKTATTGRALRLVGMRLTSQYRRCRAHGCRLRTAKNGKAIIAWCEKRSRA